MAAADRKYTQTIDYLEDFVGADIPRDALKVVLQEVDDPALSDGLPTDIQKIGGTDQSGADLLAALASVASDDELRARLLAQDDGGNLAEVQAEELGTAIGGTETALVTYVAQALASVGNDDVRVDLQANNAGTLPVEQQSPVGVEDTSDTQIDPSRASDFPNQQTVGSDLTAGDVTLGPFTVAKTQALVVSVNETTGGTVDVTVQWEDGSGNVFQTEGPTDTGLDNITEDWARLTRKGPQARVTLSNVSSATSTNAYADTHR